jgi:endonuclease/exonuclease/phosphatase family metal-dependent hydrolase
MRIVTWNCNGAFRRKFERIAALGADVAVIQECENPALSSSAYRDWAGAYAWAGSSPGKGIGVFVRNGLSVARLDLDDQGLQQFLPVRLGDRRRLLAVWTKNLPASNRGYIGQFWHYWQHHAARFDRRSILCGDFNSNAIWDRPRRAWNHSKCVAVLEARGFRSLYHAASKEDQGKETRPTFYLHRNIEKPYHLDYIFAHRSALAPEWRGLTVGDPEDWLALSDHMPVIAEL